MSLFTGIEQRIKNRKQEEAAGTIQKDLMAPTLQVTARRLLIGFFALMFALTIISRVADSITIARITTQSPKSSTLTFYVEGTGTITADAKKYIKLQDGIAIDKINVKVGQEVKKGDVLLTLDQNDVLEALKSANREAEKIENQMEQEQLSVEDTNLSTKKKDRLLYQNAKLDLENAKEDYEVAKDNVNVTESKVKQAEKEYNKALTKNVNQVFLEKTKEYKEEEITYQSVQLSNEEAINTTNKSLEEAQKLLSDLQIKDANIQDYLEDYYFYYTKDANLTKAAMEKLLIIALGDEDNYDKYKEEISSLETKLARANEDLSAAQIDLLNSNTDNFSSYQSAVTTAKRGVADAEDELDKSKKKEAKIRTEVNNYITIKAGNNNDKIQSSLRTVYESIYGTSGYKKHLEDIDAAKVKVKEAEENKNSVEKKNTLALSVEQDKLDEIQKVLDSIKDGTYDNEDAAETKKQSVDTAKQDLETKKEAIKTTKKAIDSAKRALEAAQLDYEQGREQDKKNENSLHKNKEVANLRVTALQIDLDAKRELVNQLKKMQQSEGKISAPVSGIIDSITFEAGKKSTDDNSVVIDTGGFGIEITTPKEQGEYVSIGDEIELTAKGKKDKIKVEVEDISFTNANQSQSNSGNTGSQNVSSSGSDSGEQAKITAIMPEGDYIPGATLDANITKNSDLYDICIPLSAIRSDSSGTYCLITQSRNTVLGEELSTAKVPINIIEKDNTMAAVEGALTVDDNVIISSNKNINEGDRVRLDQ